jgi:phosphohistidine phosphatase
LSIEVILVRHAIAFERNGKRWPDDRERPLTTQGKRRFLRAARGLSKWMDKPTRVITSPLLRARETAALLSTAAQWPEAIERDELAPEGTPAKVLAMLRSSRAKRVALIGHEPGLSALLSYCIAGGESTARLTMKKGGVARILFEDEIASGKGSLIALMPPRALRQME